ELDTPKQGQHETPSLWIDPEEVYGFSNVSMVQTPYLDDSLNQFSTIEMNSEEINELSNINYNESVNSEEIRQNDRNQDKVRNLVNLSDTTCPKLCEYSRHNINKFTIKSRYPQIVKRNKPII
ncbi:hypothetical protein GJ496_010401, partial [Pomphorhynchus laevis]